MLAFARTRPASIPRFALVDFNNDSVADSLRTHEAMFDRYRARLEARDEQQAQRTVLFGVRLDTSGSVRDANVPPPGDPGLDPGVTPRLVFSVRQALGRAWEGWDVPAAWLERARDYCRDVKIVSAGTQTDFTADVVRAKAGGRWLDVAKVGRRACDNPGLQPVDRRDL